MNSELRNHSLHGKLEGYRSIVTLQATGELSIRKKERTR